MTSRWICVAVMLAAGCREHELGTGSGTQGLNASGIPAAAAVAAATTTRVLYPSTPGTFVDLIANAKHGVVAIEAASPVRSGPAAMFPGTPETTADIALGTGFLVEAKGLYVITNDHIAAASSELKVVLPDRSEVPAKVLGRDPRLDLALLQLDVPNGGRGLQPLPLGDSNHIAVGEWLVVLGDPFGDDVTASAGIVSATGREGAGSLAAGRAMGYRTFIQTDARIHRGNSGGPVIDTAGQVVGVAVATGDRVGEVSFAIPIERVREVIGQLRDVGAVARSWLGVKVLPVTVQQANELALAAPSGALVTEIEAGSPASRAGVHAGDVILTWDHRDVDYKSLPWLVAQTPPGKTIVLGVWRAKAAVALTVVTETMRE
ncbi:MAG: trypsin-like peptidase domain-containing protein [Kofleriaceae bacterium]